MSTPQTADVRQEKTVRLYLLAHIQKGGVIVEERRKEGDSRELAYDDKVMDVVL